MTSTVAGAAGAVLLLAAAGVGWGEIQSQAYELSLVDLDGTVNPAVAMSQVMEMSSAAVRVKVSNDAVYRLSRVGDNDNSVWTESASNNTVLFWPIPLSEGTWAVKTLLGVEVTRFNVTGYNGTFEGIRPNEVVVLSGGVDCHIFSCWGPYYLRDMHFDSNSTPKCTVLSSGGSPDVTIDVDSGSHNKATFRNDISSEVNVGDVVYFNHPSEPTMAPDLTQGEYWVRSDLMRISATNIHNPAPLNSHIYFRIVTDTGQVEGVEVWGRCTDGFQPWVDTPHFTLRIQADA